MDYSYRLYKLRQESHTFMFLQRTKEESQNHEEKQREEDEIDIVRTGYPQISDIFSRKKNYHLI